MDRYSPSRDDRGRRKFQVIIKNLPFSVKWKTLKDKIKEVVGDVKFVNVVELGDGRSAGFGYAEFTSASDMETCVRQMHRKPFEGRDIKVFRDSDEVELRECMQLAGLPMTNLPQKQFQSGSGYLGASAGRRPGAPPATLNGVPVTSIPGFDIDEDTIQRLGEGPISNSIFVHNILFDVTIPVLRDVFSLAGSVIDVDIPKPGLAVITFSTVPEAIRAVLLLNNQELCGRKLMVKIDGDKRKKIEQDTFEDDKYGFSNSYVPRNYPPPPVAPMTRPPPAFDQPMARPGPGEPFNRVEIRNLDITVTTQEIRDLFERIGGVDRVQLSDAKCEVEYFQAQDAQAAVDRINNTLMHGRTISVMPALMHI